MMGAKVFLKIESAFQTQGVVILVVVIMMSKTVLPEQKRGLGPEEQRSSRLCKEDPDQANGAHAKRRGGGGRGRGGVVPQVLPIGYRNYINNINIFSYILAI